MSDLSKRIDALSDQQRLLLELIRKEKQAQSVQSSTIPRRSVASPCPASFAQQRLWFVDHLDPGSAAYNMPAVVRLEGSFDPAAIEASLKQIVRRHESLRTTFQSQDGVPLQVIADHLDLPLTTIELDGATAAEREATALQIVAAEARRPFDLEHGPLLRVTMLHVSEQTWLLVLVMHHIVSDAWSIKVLLHEVATYYSAYVQQTPATLPALPIQYADFAVWQQQSLQGSTLERLLAYWRRQLAEPLPAVALAPDHPRSSGQTFRGATHRFHCPPQLAEALKELSQQRQASLFMTLLAAFTTLLHRYSGQTDIVVGSPAANRNMPELQPLIGFFVNTLVLRTDLAGDPDFSSLLARVRDTVLGAYEHQDLPFDKLVEALHPTRDLNQTPLIQAVFAFQDRATLAFTLPGLEVTRLDVDIEASKIDVMLTVEEDVAGLRGLFEYNADLFEVATIERAAADFQSILEVVAADPEQHLSALPLRGRPALVADAPATSAEAYYAASNLTKNQLLFWMGQQLQPDVALYNSIITINIPAALDVSYFQQAFALVVAQSETLRTVIEVVDGIPQRRILPALDGVLELIDLSGSADPQQAYVAWLVERRVRQFILDQALVDSALVKLAPDAYVWYLAQHHINNDAWSAALITQRVSAHYQALISGAGQAEPPSAAEFQEYVAFERAYRSSPAGVAAAQYWQRKLAEQIEPITFYGHDLDKPDAQIERIAVTLDQERTSKLHALIKQPGMAALTPDLTLLSLFLTLLSSYLYRISGNRRIAIGVPFHNRFSRKFRETLGLFMESCPLHITIAEDATFVALFENVRRELLTVLQHYPYATANPPQKRAYDVLLNFHNTRFPRFADLPTEAGWIHAGYGNDSLNLQVEDFNGSGQLTLSFDFHCSIFDPPQRQRAIQHFLRVLDACLADPGQPIDRIELVTEAEQRVLLGDATHAVPTTRSLATLIETQVARTPAAVAVVSGETRLSYAELNGRANQLGHYLRQHGVGPGTLVGISLEPSADLLIGVLGVLKAGGAYVPLDPHYPVERLSDMLSEMRAPVVLTRRALGERLPSAATTLIYADDDWSALSGQPDHNLPEPAAPTDLLYVIYTSGSTGKPKGAGVYHSGFGNLLRWYIDEFDITADDRVLVITSFSFDLTQKNLFAPLIVGGQVQFQPGPYDPAAILGAIETSRISLLNCTPSAFYPLIEHADRDGYHALSHLRYVFLGGEPIVATRITAWAQHSSCRAQVVNTYGPTECTDICCFYRLQPTDYLHAGSIPIGQAVPGAQLLVLDDQARLVPLGLAGELCVAGAGVGIGYLNDRGLTARKFVPHAWATTPGERLYRTGDLVRYRADGLIDFLGRIDHQVKLRGFRIELGEIETVLRQVPGVRAAVVVTEQRPSDEQRLIAYIVPSEATAISSGELRHVLQSKLPEYMLPSVFVTLDALPLTPNGKLDRGALPTPDYTRDLAAATLVAPRTPFEQRIAAIWAELLGLDAAQIGIYDSFFELGGHSLLATQLLSRLRAGFTVELPLRRFFEQPTIAGIASYMEQTDTTTQLPAMPPIQPRTPSATAPLSFAQQQLWLIDQFEPGNAAYNSPGAVRLHGTLDRAALEHALNELVQRHEVLRTTIRSSADGPVQVIAQAQPLRLTVTDLRDEPAHTREQLAHEHLLREAQQPFSLEHGPLLRVLLLQLDDRDSLLLLTMHHIVSDAWSIVVLIRQLTALYAAFSAAQPSPLPALPIQYADWAIWQRQWMRGAVLEHHLRYWREALAGSRPTLSLPTDRRDGAAAGGAAHQFTLAPTLSERMTALNQQHGTTNFMLLLAAYATLLYAYSEQDDILIGSPVAGRQHAETEELIGYFVNTLVLRVRPAADQSFRALLAQVREMCLNAYAHQELPFEKLVEELQPTRNLGRTPMFRVWFVLQTVPMPALELPGLRVTPVEIESGQVRHDLRLALQERPDGLRGSFEYRTELFERATIEAMAQQLAQVLQAALHEPDSDLGQIIAPIRAARRAMQQDQLQRRADQSRRAFDRIRRRPRSEQE